MIYIEMTKKILKKEININFFLSSFHVIFGDITSRS